MYLSTPIRRRLAMPLALAGMLAASVASIVQTMAGQEITGPSKPGQTTAARKPASATQASKPAPSPPARAGTGAGASDRFTATATNFGAVNGETITVDLARWSTAAERDQIVLTLQEKGDKDLLAALQQSPNIGYVWRSGSAVGSVVRYACRWKALEGEHVVLATDSDLSSWQQGTTPASNAAAVQYPFTVIEIVTPAGGASAGKMSLRAKITSDLQNKTIRLENYAAAPVSLKGVRHVRSATSRS